MMKSSIFYWNDICPQPPVVLIEPRILRTFCVSYRKLVMQVVHNRWSDPQRAWLLRAPSSARCVVGWAHHHSRKCRAHQRLTSCEIWDVPISESTESKYRRFGVV